MTRIELIERNDAIVREMQSANDEQYAALEREFNANKMQIQQIDMKANAPKEQREGFSLTKCIREAIDGTKKTVELRSAITATGLAGKAVETEIQNILEPLYANSVLSALGVKWYTGMPMGDISIPVMNASSVLWKGETAAAGDGNQGFGTNVTLKPKRLTAYVDISEMMLRQDTVGVEAAIKRDLINALKDKLEATIFGNSAGDDNTPAGIFYGKTLGDATTFAKVCGIEAGVEDNNVYGEMKYLLSTAAKADLRAMAKSNKNTQLVMEGGEIDGVPALTTSNVKLASHAPYVYGNFNNLAVASWGDITLKVDDMTQATNGCVRLIVSAYFDAKILRAGAFGYGDTKYSAE